MHAALQTTELVLDILSHLDQVDLAAVARTCSRLSETALSQIWKHLYGLAFIVRLLPEGKVSVDKTLEHRFYVIESLEDVDVERVKYYAGFVKSWEFASFNAAISTEDLQKVLAGLRGQALFPNLRIFEYEGPSPFTPLLLSVIGLSVTTLKLYYNFGAELGWNARSEDVDYSAERDLLLAIKVRKTGSPVTRLSLFIDLPCTEFVCSVLTDWNDLEYLLLDIDRVDPRTLMTIASLPRLEMLDMPAVDGFDHDSLALESSCARTSALSSVILCGESVKGTLSILRPTSLSELNLVGKLAASAFRDLGMHMREVGIPDSLQVMTFRQIIPRHSAHTEGAETYAEEALLMKYIQPLLFYQNLAQVILAFNTVSLTDGDVALLARSWPRLRSLSLESASTAQSRITLPGILAFAQYCPGLGFPRLSIDATERRAIDSANIAFPRAHHRLRTLYLDNSELSSPGYVASFLTRFFPGVGPEGLVTSISDPRREEMWSDVRTLLPILLDARMTGIHGGMSSVYQSRKSRA
ncbi:hypothetical protein FB107DRAFT_206689 [Schizophyllum commune]